MTTLIFLIGITIVVIGFAISQHFFDRKHVRHERRYLLHQRRDELVFLAVENKISVEDQLFKELFEFLTSFENVCNDFSLKHVIEGRQRIKANPLSEHTVRDFIERIEKSNQDVKHAVEVSLRDAAMIVIANSVTIKFLSYLVKIAVVKYLPIWLKKQIKKLAGSLWETAKGIVLIDDNFGLQIAKR